MISSPIVGNLPHNPVRMQLKTGLFSLFIFVPLAMASPIQICAYEVQAFQPQVSPVVINGLVSTWRISYSYIAPLVAKIDLSVHCNQAVDGIHIDVAPSADWVRCHVLTRWCTASVVRVSHAMLLYVIEYVSHLVEISKKTFSCPLALDGRPHPSRLSLRGSQRPRPQTGTLTRIHFSRTVRFSHLHYAGNPSTRAGH